MNPWFYNCALHHLFTAKGVLLTHILTLVSPVAMASIPSPTHAVWFSFERVLTLILETSDKEPSGST
jgi:hypothetical protein